jgi:hypothetical protein
MGRSRLRPYTWRGRTFIREKITQRRGEPLRSAEGLRRDSRRAEYLADIRLGGGEIGLGTERSGTILGN